MTDQKEVCYKVVSNNFFGSYLSANFLLINKMNKDNGKKRISFDDLPPYILKYHLEESTDAPEGHPIFAFASLLSALSFIWDCGFKRLESAILTCEYVEDKNYDFENYICHPIELKDQW